MNKRSTHFNYKETCIIYIMQHEKKKHFNGEKRALLSHVAGLKSLKPISNNI
jgi:hypothetical protein